MCWKIKHKYMNALMLHTESNVDSQVAALSAQAQVQKFEEERKAEQARSFLGVFISGSLLGILGSTGWVTALLIQVLPSTCDNTLWWVWTAVGFALTNICLVTLTSFPVHKLDVDEFMQNDWRAHLVWAVGLPTVGSCVWAFLHPPHVHLGGLLLVKPPALQPCTAQYDT